MQWLFWLDVSSAPDRAVNPARKGVLKGSEASPRPGFFVVQLTDAPWISSSQPWGHTQWWEQLWITQLCPGWVKLSSRRRYKLKSHKTVNMDGVSATLWNHIHAHIFQNLNNIFPNWKTKLQGIIQCSLLKFMKMNVHFIVYFLTREVLTHPFSESYPDEKVLKGNKPILFFWQLNEYNVYSDVDESSLQEDIYKLYVTNLLLNSPPSFQSISSQPHLIG